MPRKEKKDRTAMIVAIVAIILIILMGITAGQRENITTIERWIGNVIAPVQGAVNKGINVASETVRSIIHVGSFKRENQELKVAIDELQKELIASRLNRDELEELRELRFSLNYDRKSLNHRIITANIIAKSPGNWFNMFTIDVGENQGVVKDSIIYASNGLVGRVFETGGNWSKVIAIIDSNSSVSFQVLRDNSIQGIISGSITNELSGFLFDSMAEVMVGDKLITSGIGLYPRGILIGEIKGINFDNTHLLKYIEVEPAVNFRRLTRVLVMIPNTTLE